MRKKLLYVCLGVAVLMGIPVGCTPEKKPLTVGAGKQFETIQDAVNAAKDGDVIEVYPGTYTESVCVTTKTLTIRGTDKEKCILQYPNGDYLNPPLEMGSGVLQNMTIHATHQEQLPGTIAKAYALHIDFHISRNNTFTIENVNFINDSYQTLGIGLRNDFTLTFKNCSFVCEGSYNAFYCHDDPSGVEAPNQKLVVDQCYFENNGAASTILLQSQEQVGSDITCVWTDNQVLNKGTGKMVDRQFWNPKIQDGAGWLDMTFWRNSEKSSGNNAEELNG
jgi:hypothetical protein